MREESKLHHLPVKHYPQPPKSLLYRRLEEALQQGTEIWVRASGSGFSGIPIHLDPEFIELVNVFVPELEDEADEEDELEETPYQRTVWLIRISDINAIAYSTESWSKERLEQLLNQAP
jgi:hypothetical protein